MYIYIYRERERDIDIPICVYVYVYVYVCVYIYIYIYVLARAAASRDLGNPRSKRRPECTRRATSASAASFAEVARLVPPEKTSGQSLRSRN